MPVLSTISAPSTASTQQTMIHDGQWGSSECTDTYDQSFSSGSPPVQDLGQRVLVHWDRGIDVRSAGQHIMCILKKIWGAERQLRTKRVTLANRQRSGATNGNAKDTSILLQQSMYQNKKWEEILNRYELELDGLVYKRFQLVRVKDQAGKHVPQGGGRVYKKVQGYTLPKADVKPNRESGNSFIIMGSNDGFNDQDSLVFGFGRLGFERGTEAGNTANTKQVEGESATEEQDEGFTVEEQAGEGQGMKELAEEKHVDEKLAEEEGQADERAKTKDGNVQSPELFDNQPAEHPEDSLSEDTESTLHDEQLAAEAEKLDASAQNLKEAIHDEASRKSEYPKETCLICYQNLTGLYNTGSNSEHENITIPLTSTQHLCLVCLGTVWGRYGNLASQFV